MIDIDRRYRRRGPSGRRAPRPVATASAPPPTLTTIAAIVAFVAMVAMVAMVAVVAPAAFTGCLAGTKSSDSPEGAADDTEKTRIEMVERTCAARGVKDPEVLRAMREVPRHLYIPEPLRPHAYEDRPLPIGENQTISQPYIVALMTELAEVRPKEKVLEIGTGSGYQAAVLAAMKVEVWTIEILPALADRARGILTQQGHGGIHFRTGDGYAGWEEAAPFDAIIVTAAPDHIPRPLIDQLAVGGRLVIPVGDAWQELIRITRTPEGIVRESIIPVRFVPMTGEAQRRP